MLLSRFIEHLRAQNWFAVSLDVIVVIVGIYLGMQATEWHENRKEAAAGKNYLLRIRDDLLEDRNKLLNRKVFWNQVIDYAGTAIEYAETQDLDEKTYWDLLLAYFQASQIAPFEATDTTYMEMQSAGQLALIDSQELRGELARYYSFHTSIDAKTLLQAVPEYRSQVRSFFPSHITRHIWRNCHSSGDLAAQKLMDCDSPVEEDDAKKLLDKLASIEELTGSLRMWFSTLSTAESTVDVNLQAIDTMLGRIDTLLLQ